MMQPQSLTNKQLFPLTAEERALIQQEAKDANITTGLFCRALILYALDRIDSDPAVHAALIDEKADARARTSAGAKRAIAVRWENR